MKGVVSAPGGFGPMNRRALGAGWRRAYRLAGRLDAAAVHESQTGLSIPLDRGEKSAIVKTVDVNVPPDQPPSSPDSPASEDLCLGLSATGIAFTVFESFAFPSSSLVSRNHPGCGVTPSGLT